MSEKLFLNEMAHELRIAPRTLRWRMKGPHRVFWEGKVLAGYRKTVEREDFEKYIAWLKRSGLDDHRGRGKK